MHPAPYPLHLDAQLDPGVSRWLWLVKWLLVLPHYFVLAFLWLAFVVLSAVAFVAILVTGRYPRSIFDFNVGVLRWSWRVAYYAYGALGTDRYPPFSLEESPDYPAHLSVDYPEHLSRGLVLVKWWLLAIPHYLVVAFFLGSGVYLARDGELADAPWLWGGGLIGLLVLVAAVVLLVTGRYPQPIYDLVLGMNRWVLRVAAYAGLMTDTYPPFRLDQGGADPDDPHLALSAPPAAPAAGPGSTAGPSTALHSGPPPGPPPYSAPRTGSRWTFPRVITLAIGCLLLAVGLGLGAAGVTGLVIDQTQRDAAGFVTSPTRTVVSDGWAVTSGALNVEGDGDVVPEEVLGDTTVSATVEDGEVFVGIARTADVDAYLAGVGHSQVVDFTNWSGDPIYEQTSGTAPAEAPGDSDIWVAQASGPGRQSLTWDTDRGEWTTVVMDADAAQGVRADVAIGAEAPNLWGVAIATLVAGAGVLVLGVALVIGAVRAASRAGGRPAGPPQAERYAG
jgi:hypothetical protein